MKTVCVEIPDDLDPLEWGSHEGLACELRLAAAIQWYSRGIVSQSRAAEIAGLDRTGFLQAFGRAKVDAFQITDDELNEEVERGVVPTPVIPEVVEAWKLGRAETAVLALALAQTGLYLPSTSGPWYHQAVPKGARPRRTR